MLSFQNTAGFPRIFQHAAGNGRFIFYKIPDYPEEIAAHNFLINKKPANVCQALNTTNNPP